MSELVQRLDLLEIEAKPRLTKAIGDLQIDADEEEVLRWISSLAEAIQDLWGISPQLTRSSSQSLHDEVKREMQERKKQITEKFGFKRAEHLELNHGTPLIVVPDYFLDGSRGVSGDTTIAVARVAGSWEKRWGKGGSYSNMLLQTRPIISYVINNGTMSFSPPLVLLQELSIYPIASYLSRAPFIDRK